MKFIVEGFCQGSSPIEDEDIEILSGEEFYSELINLISNNDQDEAIKCAEKYFNAEYCLDNVSALDDEGFEFVETSSVNLNNPFLEEVDGVKVPLFKWIGAEFILKGPREVVRNWMKEADGKFVFNDELFEEWMEQNGVDSLQDGCCYNLGSACYGLNGFGENGCSINTKSLEQAFHQE